MPRMTFAAFFCGSIKCQIYVVTLLLNLYRDVFDTAGLHVRYLL